MFAVWIWLSYDCYVFFFKQKTAYEMRISDWSSDVCSFRSLNNRIAALTAENARLRASVMQLIAFRNTKVWEATELAGRLRTVRALAEIGRASCRERVCQYV